MHILSNFRYEVSWTKFHTEKLENFNWNHLDFYVCTRGDSEYALSDKHKYWRFRLMAIPLNLHLKTTKKIVENLDSIGKCFKSVYFSKHRGRLTSHKFEMALKLILRNENVRR